jgi:peptidoglycan/xylan/chitin deacetylase (PgdA/CDA1 family)
MHQAAVTAVAYRHVLPDGCPVPSDRAADVTYVSEFARQIDHFAAHAHVMRQIDLRRLLDGRPPSRDAVLITFDGGYRNNFACAFPVLQRAGAAALFFVTSSFAGDRRRRLWVDRLDAALAAEPQKAEAWLAAVKPFARLTPDALRSALTRLPAPDRDAIVADVEEATGHRGAAWFDPALVEPMTWDEVRALARAGMQIGAHSDTHQILAAASRPQLFKEVRLGRVRIESQIGCECWAFSYPGGARGDFGAREIDALQQAGFRCAFSKTAGPLVATSSPYDLPRVSPAAALGVSADRQRPSALQRVLASPLLAFLRP